ncbi:hypothetical protein PMAYCL1PPCAC_11505, partial [Pristionchus mayeri]
AEMERNEFADRLRKIEALHGQWKARVERVEKERDTLSETCEKLEKKYRKVLLMWGGSNEVPRLPAINCRVVPIASKV